MLDLKYLTIADLENFAENLKTECIRLKKAGFHGRGGDFRESQFKENEKQLHQVETEILERTLLGAGNPGGAST